MLALACLGADAVYAGLTLNDDPAFVRYLAPLVMFGAILAGRTAGRLVESGRRIVRLVSLRRFGVAIGAAVLAAYVAVAAVLATRPPLPSTNAELARFLEAHDLRDGIGSYWVASITTLASGGQVAVRPVIGDTQGDILRYDKQSAAEWYAGQAFQFLAYDEASPWKGVNATMAVANFGPVTRVYAVGTFRVLVWSHSIWLDPDRYSD
jgi:hypothetical protein